MWMIDTSWEGFKWISCNDYSQNILAFYRTDGKSEVVVVCNFAPVVRENYRIGVPRKGIYKEALNSDDPCYGGFGYGNKGDIITEPVEIHGFDNSVSITVPPQATVYLQIKNN